MRKALITGVTGQGSAAAGGNRGSEGRMIRLAEKRIVVTGGGGFLEKDSVLALAS